MSGQPTEQTNRLLGCNTAYFHLQYPLPDLQHVPLRGTPGCCDNIPYNGQLPFPGEIDAVGGTPNQKTERVANQIASHFFVTPNKTKGPGIYDAAVTFFNDQAQKTGHQCVGSQDEALTASHGPIWWRAIMSLRITSWAIANGKVSWFSDSTLEKAILGWIGAHYSLNKLGEILGGPQRGKVLLPGARWAHVPPRPTLFPGSEAQSASGATSGNPYPSDPMTDQVSNVMYQILKTGSISGVPWQLGDDFWVLDPCNQDRVACPLAKSVLDNGLALGASQSSSLPLLQSKLVVDRYSNGHVASFPCGMPNATGAAVWAWADYETGSMALSPQSETPPVPGFQGSNESAVVPSVQKCPAHS
jgi:hypothetical protein